MMPQQIGIHTKRVQLTSQQWRRYGWNSYERRGRSSRLVWGEGHLFPRGGAMKGKWLVNSERYVLSVPSPE